MQQTQCVWLIYSKRKLFFRGSDIANENKCKPCLKPIPTNCHKFCCGIACRQFNPGPAVFLETNVKGTFTLLEEARKLWMESE